MYLAFTVVLLSPEGCTVANKDPMRTPVQSLVPPQQSAPAVALPVHEIPLAAAEPIADAPAADRTERATYRIGVDDELDISVYGESDLAETQSVRPDGKIAFPLIGDIRASGLTPDELREQMVRKLAKFVRNPQVTVIVSAYKSKRVSVLGEVLYPGVVSMSAPITLLEGISKAGGLTERADLEGSMLVRQGQVVPVNFEELMNGGDLARNNQPLQPADVILIPNITAKKVFVLGEVNRPLVTTTKYGVNLAELIAMAGGFTHDAERKNVLVVRGGLSHPTVLKIDVDAVARGENQNVALRPGDIVYAPRTLIADTAQFMAYLSNILQPIVLAETGIVLGPNVYSTLVHGRTQTPTGVVVSP